MSETFQIDEHFSWMQFAADQNTLLGYRIVSYFTLLNLYFNIGCITLVVCDSCYMIFNMIVSMCACEWKLDSKNTYIATELSLKQNFSHSSLKSTPSSLFTLGHPTHIIYSLWHVCDKCVDKWNPFRKERQRGKNRNRFWIIQAVRNKLVILYILFFTRDDAIYK